MSIQKVCVYCASSKQVDPSYHRAAYHLGQVLAEAGITVVYGGGGIGSMGKLADGALSQGGQVIGVIPRFMAELEWGHRGITKLVHVEDMHQRKRMMIEDTDAVIALPGGTGTFEELFEAITLKRLGFYLKPIILVNTNNFYDPCIQLLKRSIAEHFMDARHKNMWSIVDTPDQVLDAIASAPVWQSSARNFAAV
jgi:uncharacterized protein (TIGR00730 family)